MTTVKTYLADIHQLFIEGIERIIDEIDYPKMEIVGRAYSAEELQKALSEVPVDLLFMELNFVDDDGLTLIKQFKREYPEMRICVLSGYTDHKFVKEAFQNGADGYYSKYNPSSELTACINEIMLGKTFLASGIQITPKKNGSSKFAEVNYLEDRFLLKKKLTRREQEVLELITKAMNNKEIAEKLYISDQTVGVHRKNIMRKLNVRNTVNLIKFAIDHQLV